MPKAITKPTPEQLDRIAHAPMAMRRESLETLAHRIVMGELFEEPPELEEETVEFAVDADQAGAPRLPKVQGAVAVVPVFGGVAQHRGSDYWGGVFTEELVGLLARLVDSPNVGAVVLSFDSPGGIVFGVPEAAGAIRALSQVKPIYGHVKAQAASAAYWLATATTKLFVQPSSEVGSIGVWTMHIDASEALKQIGWDITMISAGKYKTEGHPFGPLDDDARDHLQEGVDRYYDDFLDGVATGRGVTKATVRNDFGEGRMLDAAEAKRVGMVDGICTLGELLAGVMPPVGSKRRTTAATRIALAEACGPELEG